MSFNEVVAELPSLTLAERQQLVLRALELRFKRADAFKQMLFEGWPQKAIDSAVSRGGGSVGYY